MRQCKDTSLIQLAARPLKRLVDGSAQQVHLVLCHRQWCRVFACPLSNVLKGGVSGRLPYQSHFKVRETQGNSGHTSNTDSCCRDHTIVDHQTYQCLNLVSSAGCGSFFCKDGLCGSDNQRAPPRMIGRRTAGTRRDGCRSWRQRADRPRGGFIHWAWSRRAEPQP